MAITLTTSGNFVDDTTPVDNLGTAVIDTTSAETVTLPPASTSPVGYKFLAVRAGANAVTFAAVAGETIVGITTLSADGESAWVVRSGATEWTVLLAAVSS